MSVLQEIAAKLRAGRRFIVAALIVGAAVVAALMLFVPSQLGFMLAGPLVFFPWMLLCAGLARKPSDFALATMALFGLIALAWPIICLI